MKVIVSPCSSLFYLLIKQFDDDPDSLYNSNDISDIMTLHILGSIENVRKVHSYTIKLKKTSLNVPTSFGDLQNDLYTALYYLSVLFPSRFNELPIIANPLSEAELEDEAYVNFNRDRNVSKRSVPKPTHPIALRYFYHADHLVLKGVGQEAVLYYYKVLEYFFDEAWRYRIEELLTQTNGDTYTMAEKLVEEQPHREVDSLSLVVNFEPNHCLWQTVAERKFSDKTVKSLTKKIYDTRNELAHGKDKQQSHIPLLFFNATELNGKLAVFRAVAKAVLLKFGGITV